MTRFPLLHAGLLYAALASTVAHAGTPIDERHALKADGRVYIANVSGLIEVSAWDRPEVHISGELGEGAERLEVSGDASSLRIEVRMPRKSSHAADTDLRVRVPAAAALSLEAVSADIVVQGIKGRLAASTVSGDLSLSVASAEVEASTVSGDLRLSGPAGNTVLNSISGDVSASGLSGELRLETVSGAVRVAGGAFTNLELKSISGDLDLDASLAPDARVVGETLSGQLHLRLPAATSATVALRSFSGEVQSRFGGGHPGDDDRRERLEFKLGDGRARVDLSSFSGDIMVDKR